MWRDLSLKELPWMIWILRTLHCIIVKKKWLYEFIYIWCDTRMFVIICNESESIKGRPYILYAPKIICVVSKRATERISTYSTLFACFCFLSLRGRKDKTFILTKPSKYIVITKHGTIYTKNKFSTINVNPYSFTFWSS